MKSQLIKGILLTMSCLVVLAHTQTWAQTDLDTIKKSLPQPIVRTPNPNYPDFNLPLEVLIQGISVTMEGKDPRTFKGYECGLMCFDAVARFQGKNIPWTEIHANVTPNQNYPMLFSLQDYAIRKGFKCATFYDCSEDKRKIKFYLSQHIPVFIHEKLKIGDDMIVHAVLIIGYNDRANCFWYLDSQDRLTNPNWEKPRYWGGESFNSFHHSAMDIGHIIYDASMTINKTQPYCKEWNQPIPQPRFKYE